MKASKNRLFLLFVLFSSSIFLSSRIVAENNGRDNGHISAEAKNKPGKKAKSIVKIDARGLSCHDGDTCRVETMTKDLWKIRLWGIDAPETKQAYGRESQSFIEKLVKGKALQLECHGMSFDRHTCRIFSDGTDVGQQLVLAGLAWEAPQYSKKTYSPQMTLAKNEKRGLWQETSLVSPYCFRKPTSKHCKGRQTYMP
ncbi:MAG: thermonuclease family protein [Bdellovibrionales bacterium]|nr:thermonuclease family protein [Bdellovibrionales bacterium]